MSGIWPVFSFLICRAGSTGIFDNFSLNLAAEGLTDECWVSNVNERGACNDNGFCHTNGAKSLCSCFYGFEGSSCQLNVKAITCSQMDCGFSGIQGACVTDLSGEATCACFTGWSGASCSENVEVVDYCEGISCNNQGECVVDLTSETMWSCDCNPFWGGTECGEELPECGSEILMDMFNRISSTTGNLDASLECGYVKPAIFSSLTPAKSDRWTFAPCVCVSLIEKVAMWDFNHVENTCLMDKFRDLPFIQEVKAYCPACTSIQDNIMEDVLTTKTPECYHFIYQRTDMPLYWRSIWKCSCVLDVGNQATAETIINCPFTQHNSVDDYISYENCNAKKVCDWESMYTYFEVEYSKKSLEGSVACKDWMEEWIFTVPGEQRFEDMESTFCPCLEYLKGTDSEDVSILDCIPITFHQLTMVELYEQICYDPIVANKDCLNYISYGSIRLAAVNYTAASLCWGAVDLAAGSEALSDNLNTLMCDCVVPLKDDDYYYEETTIYALACMKLYYEDFAVLECPGYNSSESSDDESSDAETDSSDAEVSLIAVGDFETMSLSSESVWKATTIVEVSVSTILVTTAFFLQRRKSRLNQ